MGYSILAIEGDIKMAKRSGAYKEYYLNTLQDTNLSSGTGVVFTDVDLRLDTDADFELNKISHVATSSDIKVTFKDDAFGRFYQNSPLDLRNISGTILSGITPNGFLPYILPSPVLIQAATNFTAAFADDSGSGNSIRMSLHGAKIRTGNAPWNYDWRARASFFYRGTATLDADSTASLNIPINIDSHFLVKKITAFRTGAALITVKDSATDRQWMDKPVHIDNFAGNSQFPNILPAPRFIQRGTVINITLQDLSSSSNIIDIVFTGEKLF